MSQFSEIIHNWTLGSLLGLLCFHEFVPEGPCSGVGLEFKI